MRFVSALLLGFVFSVSGCALLSNADNLIPIPAESEYESYSAKMRTISPNGDPTLSEFRSQLIVFIGEYHKRAAERRKMEWDSSGMATYGGLGAVLGGIANKTGLINTGAGIAGIGLATGSRYNFSQQSLVYFNALKKLSCIEAKVSSVPSTVLDDAKLSDDVDAANIAKGGMKQLIDAVDNVRIEAINGMLGISPTTPTRDELLTMFNAYKPGVNTANAPQLGVSADMTRQRAAAETFKVLLSEVAVCVKL